MKRMPNRRWQAAGLLAMATALDDLDRRDLSGGITEGRAMPPLLIRKTPNSALSFVFLLVLRREGGGE